jgi:hypothetical protein
VLRNPFSGWGEREDLEEGWGEDPEEGWGEDLEEGWGEMGAV